MLLLVTDLPRLIAKARISVDKMSFLRPSIRAVVAYACLNWARDALTICRLFCERHAHRHRQADESRPSVQAYLDTALANSPRARFILMKGVARVECGSHVQYPLGHLLACVHGRNASDVAVVI